MGQTDVGAEHVLRAYDLRDRVSEGWDAACAYALSD
jgi:hypothetical protein